MPNKRTKTRSSIQLTEAKLRDSLANQIQVLEPGLTLLDREKYIPSSIGTRSFIDLLAKDRDRHWVVIELKRSDVAAREAIHEILKYVEAVKSHLGAREHEIRCFIVSTEWHELLVPFSRFVFDATISTTGFQLTLGKRSSLHTKRIEPLKITGGRLLAPWHELNLYKSEASLTRGIRSYEQRCRTLGISDFVLLALDAPPDFGPRSKQQFKVAMQDILRDFGADIHDTEIERQISLYPTYTMILYFAMQLLDRSTCVSMLSRHRASRLELKDLLPTLEAEDPEDLLQYLHNSIFALPPTAHHDSYEIGYPAKLTGLLGYEGWTVRQIKRFGVFARNQLLTDQSIIEELSGSEGTSHQKFNREAEQVLKVQEGEDVVLVSVESMKALRLAYPNYFADTHHFVSVLKSGITVKPESKFDKFTKLVDRVLSVPHSEIMKREKEYQKQQALKPKRGPKQKFKPYAADHESGREG